MGKLSYNNKKGVALLITILLMTLILFMAMYFLSFTLTEKKIAHSQVWGAKTYYLAEAGVSEIVWQLKNNETYKTNFETNPSWTEEFTRNNPFGAGSGSYTVSITNSALAHGDIVSTGSIDIGEGKVSQRIVKTSVYKAITSGDELDIGDSGIFADNNIDVLASEIDLYNASLHANNDVDIGIFSNVDIFDYDIRAVNKYSKSSWATVNVAGDIYDNYSYPPQPDSLGMPPVSFNDPEDPNSLKNQADVIYSESQFQTLLDGAGSSLTLNDPITYVTGDIEFEGNPDITINGLLVAEGTITIGKPSWCFIICFCTNGNTSLTVNHTAGQPSGIFSKEKIRFSYCSEDVEVDGVFYASVEIQANEFDLFNPGDTTVITGGVFSRDINFFSISQPFVVTLDNDIITDTIGETTEFSPVITVEHWEEEY